VIPAPASRLDRAAALVVILGAIGVVLAASAYKTFDLDRFFVPKELVLHVAAATSAVLVLERLPRASFGVIDLLLGGFLALSLVSAVAAQNHWLAARAVAVSASGIILFWTVRTLARAGLARRLLAGICVAVVLGALTALAQAYGVVSEYASLARAPGGTFGNRNFMAHLSAIGVPSLVYLALSTRRRAGALLAVLGLAIVAAAVVLSRSRAAWVALLVTGVLLLAGTLWRWRVIGPSAARRASMLGIAVVAAVAGALLLPNALEWKSDSPYLDSVAGVVNYRSGSGRGRLIQYRTSLTLAMRHPVLGVGPGNWAVEYPRVAKRGDPSLTDAGMTANPWPSSDWAAFVSERGGPAALLLALAFAGILVVALFRLRDALRPEQALEALALAGTVTTTLAVGAFDAVLLLAAPALVAWALLGTLGATVAPLSRWTPALHPARRRLLVVLVAAFGVLSTLRSASQLGGMAIFHGADRLAEFERAARVDPGSYRIRLRTAEAAMARGDCRRVRTHAGAANELFPAAPAPRRLLRRCGRR
jgi:O-antigen ligase